MSIVQNGDPVLRKRAPAILESEFGSKELLSLISKMAKVLDKEVDMFSVGVALAAPQIGVSKRLFVVRMDRVSVRHRDDALPAEIRAFINPRIVKTFGKKILSDEGCLSVRYIYGYVPRYERVTIEAKDEHGKLVRLEGTGLLAQVFQHEIDHLDGMLFIDEATEIWQHGPDDDTLT